MNIEEMSPQSRVPKIIKRNILNLPMFFEPTHLPMKTQWWSKSVIQQLQILQCLVFWAMGMLHLLQNLLNSALGAPAVLLKLPCPISLQASFFSYYRKAMPGSEKPSEKRRQRMQRQQRMPKQKCGPQNTNLRTTNSMRMVMMNVPISMAAIQCSVYVVGCQRVAC